jgi:hypothetical protein
MRSLYIQAACSDAGKIIFSTSEFPLVEILPAGSILMYGKYWIALKNN